MLGPLNLKAESSVHCNKLGNHHLSQNGMIFLSIMMIWKHLERVKLFSDMLLKANGGKQLFYKIANLKYLGNLISQVI